MIDAKIFIALLVLEAIFIVFFMKPEKVTIRLIRRFSKIIYLVKRIKAKQFWCFLVVITAVIFACIFHKELCSVEAIGSISPQLDQFGLLLLLFQPPLVNVVRILIYITCWTLIYKIPHLKIMKGTVKTPIGEISLESGIVLSKEVRFKVNTTLGYLLEVPKLLAEAELGYKAIAELVEKDTTGNHSVSLLEFLVTSLQRAFAKGDFQSRIEVLTSEESAIHLRREIQAAVGDLIQIAKSTNRHICSKAGDILVVPLPFETMTYYLYIYIWDKSQLIEPVFGDIIELSWNIINTHYKACIANITNI